MKLSDYSNYANSLDFSPNIEREFREVCEDNARNNISGKVKSINLFLVHPLFDELDKRNPKHENIKRLEELVRLLPKHIGKVLFENHRFYGRQTYKLVEGGIFDHVFFTPLLDGGLFDNSQLSIFSNSIRNYFAGCYEFECVGRGAMALNEYVDKSKIFIVSDCSINNHQQKEHYFQTTNSSNLLLLR